MGTPLDWIAEQVAQAGGANPSFTGALLQAGLVQVVSNSVAPTTTDDSSSGYQVGYMWWDTSSSTWYRCDDNTASAAVWSQIDLPASTTVSGIVELATNAETITGTDTSRATTPAGVAAALAAASLPTTYRSTGQTITLGTGGRLTLAHGLGSVPDFVSVKIKCTTAELGYSIGDEVMLNLGGDDTGSGSTAVQRGEGVRIDSTNVYLTFGSGGVTIQDYSTGGYSVITVGNWQAYVTATVMP